MHASHATGTARKRRVTVPLIAVIAGALALGTTACNVQDKPGAKGAGGRTDVRVALDWKSYVAYHAPLIVAEKKGYFKKEGINTKLKLTGGSKDGVQEVGTGKADVGWVDLSTASYSMLAGLPVKAVATVQHKNATGLTMLADSPIRKPGDVRGKRIGSTPGGSDSTLVPAFLAANNIDKDDVTIVNLPANGKFAALLAGEVDAISGQGYYAASAIEDAGKKSRTILYSDVGANVLDHGFVASERFLKGNGETTTAFLRAYRQGLDYTAKNQEESCRLVAAESGGTLTEKFCRSQLKGWLELVPGEDKNAAWGTNKEAEWKQTLHILKTYGGAEGDEKPTDMYTNKYLPADK
ncbi:ABC transporter substrate-binding protein [Streptomyces sp. NPDC055078]